MPKISTAVKGKVASLPARNSRAALDLRSDFLRAFYKPKKGKNAALIFGRFFS
jgi:hypothetical protein